MILADQSRPLRGDFQVYQKPAAATDFSSILCLAENQLIEAPQVRSSTAESSSNQGLHLKRWLFVCYFFSFHNFDVINLTGWLALG